MCLKPAVSAAATVMVSTDGRSSAGRWMYRSKAVSPASTGDTAALPVRPDSRVTVSCSSSTCRIAALKSSAEPSLTLVKGSSASKRPESRSSSR